MSIIAMGSGGGLNNTKLRLADAAVDDVLRGRKFYSGDKTLKTGTLELTGTAGTDDVLAGVTFYSTNAKSKQTGTLFLTGTAGADDVLAGVTFYSTNAKSKQTGTLFLTGNAGAGDVLKGFTFYNTDAKTKVTGTLALTGTASANDVLYGETFYNTDAKTKVTGTLALTGTASANDVLYGETFYNTNAKTKVTGTMPNHGALGDRTLNPGDVISVPYGYYSIGGKITARNITTADVLGQIHEATLDTSVPCGGNTSYSTGGKKCIGISYVNVNSGSSGTIRFCQIIDNGYTINAGCDGSTYLTIRFYYV